MVRFVYLWQGVVDLGVLSCEDVQSETAKPEIANSGNPPPKDPHVAPSVVYSVVSSVCYACCVSRIFEHFGNPT